MDSLNTTLYKGATGTWGSRKCLPSCLDNDEGSFIPASKMELPWCLLDPTHSWLSVLEYQLLPESIELYSTISVRYIESKSPVANTYMCLVNHELPTRKSLYEGRRSTKVMNLPRDTHHDGYVGTVFRLSSVLIVTKGREFKY